MELKEKIKEQKENLVQLRLNIRNTQQNLNNMQYNELVAQNEILKLKRELFMRKTGITHCPPKREKTKKIKKDKTPNELINELKGWSDDKINELKRLLEKNA